MIDSLTITTALTIGIAGSTHCVAMCGGISSGLSYQTQAPRRTTLLARQLQFNLGRIASYALAGLIAGSALQAVTGWQQQLMLPLRVFAALMLVAVGLYITGWWQGVQRIEALGARLWRWIQPLSRYLLPIRHGWQALALGGLWGWLPCGLVYSTLLWAASAASPIESAARMALFGLGTMPALILTGLATAGLMRFMGHPRVRLFLGLMVVFYGLLNLLLIWIKHAQH